jgi:hypothetical protein
LPAPARVAERRGRVASRSSCPSFPIARRASGRAAMVDPGPDGPSERVLRV